MLSEQVVLILLANAVEALPNGHGNITMKTGTTRTTSGDLGVFMEISDSGIGIPAEGLSKLFTPCYTTKAQGTGLRLAIAKKFTELHGGAITAANRVGGGATIYLFGSAAKGVREADSDLDGLSITPGRLLGQEEAAVVEAIYELELTRRVVISTLFYSREEGDAPLTRASPFRAGVEAEAVLV